MATHLKFRKENGCPPKGNCQMPWYPYTSWITLFALILAILSMPFISGQGSGLIAGLLMISMFTGAYWIQRSLFHKKTTLHVTDKPLIKGIHLEDRQMIDPLDSRNHDKRGAFFKRRKRVQYSTEFSNELAERRYDLANRSKKLADRPNELIDKSNELTDGPKNHKDTPDKNDCSKSD